MSGTRYEEYEQLRDGLPFVLNADLIRTRFHLSREHNWHENLEIQFCTEGSGSVFMDGHQYSFQTQDIAVINSNVIHYTGTEQNLIYDCLIIGTDFCRQIGLDPQHVAFAPMIQDPEMTAIFKSLKQVYFTPTLTFRSVLLHKLVLDLLLTLAQKHNLKKSNSNESSKSYERVKKALIFIRNHYPEKITLEDIARAAFCDKYTLCKDFKKHTGQTPFENLNNYRCIRAIEQLTTGHPVAETAVLCGFENLSFFTRTFKHYTGKLPSEYKK